MRRKIAISVVATLVALGVLAKVYKPELRDRFGERAKEVPGDYPWHKGKKHLRHFRFAPDITAPWAAPPLLE